MKDRDRIRDAIRGTSIAIQSHHHRDLCGLGEVTVEDMARFMERAEADVRLFDEAVSSEVSDG